MIKLTAFHPIHLEMFEHKDIFDGLEDLRERVIEVFQMPNNKMASILYDEQIVGVLGIALIHDGVAEVWSVLSDEFSARPISAHKFIKKELESQIKTERLHRVQCTVRKGNKKAARWMQSLGFRCEGLMRNFESDKSDCYLFARTA